jgi:hypothetical protein
VPQKRDIEIFYLRNVNNAEVKEQYEVNNISNMYAALENLDDDYVDIDRPWGSKGDYIKK